MIYFDSRLLLLVEVKSLALFIIPMKLIGLVTENELQFVSTHPHFEYPGCCDGYIIISTTSSGYNNVNLGDNPKR